MAPGCAAIEADPAYRSLRIINVVDPGWVQQLVLNTGATNAATQACANVFTAGSYAKGVGYALTNLRRGAPNIYTYLDAGSHSELGWEDTMPRAVQLQTDAVRGTTDGFASADGFVTNIAGYDPLTEPCFAIDTVVGGQSVRMTRWVDWNSYVDELPYALAVRTTLIKNGFSSQIGIIVDTSRNSWGGPKRPTRRSASTDVSTFVDESRVDRRPTAQDWCNQVGAGLGERPVAAPKTGIDAYAWIKRPGESDGASPKAADTGGRLVIPSGCGANDHLPLEAEAGAQGSGLPGVRRSRMLAAHPTCYRALVRCVRHHLFRCLRG